MKKTLSFVIVMTGVLSFSSCKSNQAVVQQPQQPMYQNYAGYGQYPPQQFPQQQAPQAVDDGFAEVAQSPIEKLALAQNTGQIRSYGQAESPNEQLALNTARAQALGALQEKVEAYVRYGLNQYMDQTQVNDQTSFDAKTRNEIVVAAKGILNGAVVLDQRKLYNNKKSLYKYEVCLVYDRAGIMGAMEAQSQRILQNRAQFEKDMQSAWDELDRNNGKVPLREEQANRENEREQQNLDRQNERNQQALDRQNQRDVNIINATANKASYYLVLNGQQQGPFTYQQLQGMAASGQINRETKAWREGMATWSSLGLMSEMNGLFTVKSTGSVPPPMY